jgi:MerR family mercuric resistance operon transcriptional regulator
MDDTEPSATYQIGELAARSGITPDALRYYERLGLLQAPRRTRGGFRVYPAETLDRLRFIKQAQTVGLTLHEIGELVGYQDQGGLKRCRQVRDLLKAKLVDLQAKLTELAEFRDTLSGYLGKCEQTLVSGQTADRRRAEPDCPVIETLQTKHKVKGREA